MRAFDQRGQERTELLQQNAGINPVEDARMSGYILAIKDFLLVEFEESQQQ